MVVVLCIQTTHLWRAKKWYFYTIEQLGTQAKSESESYRVGAAFCQRDPSCPALPLFLCMRHTGGDFALSEGDPQPAVLACARLHGLSSEVPVHQSFPSPASQWSDWLFYGFEWDLRHMTQPSVQYRIIKAGGTYCVLTPLSYHVQLQKLNLEIHIEATEAYLVSWLPKRPFPGIILQSILCQCAGNTRFSPSMHRNIVFGMARG